MHESNEPNLTQIHVAELPDVPKRAEIIDAALQVEKLPGADVIMAPPLRKQDTHIENNPERPSRLRAFARRLGERAFKEQIVLANEARPFKRDLR